MQKLYNVGVYIRLSLENTAYANESMSIESQQMILSKFISMMPGWVEKRKYVDNGASGANFDRKGFQDMMTDIRRGEINLVLCKDLSRFGRNYLEAGRYIEEVLPSLNCRFVALDDNIDSESGENDIMPFINGLNDYYLKNLSNRIKTVLLGKAKEGKYLSGETPYGYMRNPDDKNQLIVDEYAANIVRRIFEMRLNGLGYGKIAFHLNNEGVLPPRLYYYTRLNKEPPKTHTKYWQQQGVKSIEKNEVYIGNSVYFKKKTVSYRDKKLVDTNPDEWLRVENTHTPIIEKSVWEELRELSGKNKEKSKSRRDQVRSLFTGKIFCMDCGESLIANTEKQTRKTGKEVRYTSYACKKFLFSGGSICSRHTIYEISLKNLILEDIRRCASIIMLDEGRMLETLQNKLLGKHSANKVSAKQEKRDLEQQLHTLEIHASKLYEDRIEGLISDDRFSEMIAQLEEKRTDAQNRLCSLTDTTNSNEERLANIQSWVQLIKESSALSDLDKNNVEALIEKIEIGERKVTDGMKSQDVRIFYKFVGTV